MIENLRFTRHLSVTVQDTDRGNTLFRLLLARLAEISPLSLRFVGALDGESYTELYRLLTSEERGKLLRSKLRNLDLPMRPTRETLWRDRYELDTSADDGVFNHSAIIKFQSYKQLASPMTRKISVLGYRHHGLNFGTPYNAARNIIRTMGIKTRCIDELVVLGRGNPTRDRLASHLQNPFRNFGLHFASKPFWLKELSLVGLNLQQLPSAIYTSFNVTSLRVLQLKQSIYL